MSFLVVEIFLIGLLVLITVGLEIYIVFSLVKCEFGKYPTFIASFGQPKKIVLEEARNFLKKSKKNLKIVDLGCGNGTLLIPLAKEFPNHQFYGYDWDEVAYRWAKKRTKGLKNIVLFKKDFMKENFQDADLVLCYLVHHLAQKVGIKLNKELTHKALIISEMCPLTGLVLKKEVISSFLGIRIPIFIYENSKKIKK